MLNLYEILEVSEKASQEVIDKAYHVLVKKYHPDLQPTVEKKWQAEAKMKKINEAYDILGNEQKRKIYDLKLKQELEEKKIIERRKHMEELEEYSNMYKTRIYNYNQNRNISNYVQKENNMQKIQNGILGAFKQLFSDYWARRKQKTKQPWTLKRVLELSKVLAILIIIIIIVAVFPPTNKLIVGSYERNPAVKTIVDILGQIIGGLFSGIITFFKNGSN